jgi:hypothetical protein
LELGAPTISVEIEGMTRRLILDTGSNVSIMQQGISIGDVGVTSAKPNGVTGETLDIKGQKFVSFTLEGQEYKHPFLVCPLPTDAADLLGINFLEKTGAEINFECGKMSLTDIDKVSRVYSFPPVGVASLTVFAEGKVRHSPQPSKLETRHTDEKFSASLSSEKTVQLDKSWVVKATENITIAPPCRKIVLGKLKSEKGQPPSTGLCRTCSDSDRRDIFGTCTFTGQTGNTGTFTRDVTQ